MSYSNKLEAWWVSQNSHDQLTWMQFMELRLQALESQAATPPAEMPSFSPAIERQEATPPGPSTSSETYWTLVRAGQAGGGIIQQGKVLPTFLGPSFTQIPGDVLKLWQEEPSALLLLSTPEWLWPSGATPLEQMQSERVPGGLAAGGSTGYRRISDD